MSCWHSEDRATLDLRRGLKFARAAYRTRIANFERRVGFDGPWVAVPAIVKAHFEDIENEPARVLVEYDAEAIAKAT